MDLYFFLKLLVVALFLAMFLRGSRIVWGIGLLTVTTALLFDTILGTFGREQLQAELGFFFYVISGALFSGAAIWLWGLLRSKLKLDDEPRVVPASGANSDSLSKPPPATASGRPTGVDRHMLFEEIHSRLSPEEIRDLIFDVELNENDVLSPHGEMAQSIERLIAAAEQDDKMGPLALAVERILTPLPPESLPRLENLNADSPPTVLRHYLLAHFSMAELSAMTSELQIDGEQLSGGNKKEMVRNLLLYLERRNRLHELIQLLHAPTLDLQ